MKDIATKIYLLLLLLPLAGCAQGFYVKHGLYSKVQSIGTIGILTPEIKVVRVAEDGSVSETIDEAAGAIAVKAMADFFQEAGYTVRIFEEPYTSELYGAKALSKVVHRSIIEFWDPVNTDYPYTLGSLYSLDSRQNALDIGIDALVFMDSSEHIYSGPKPFKDDRLKAIALEAFYGPEAVQGQDRRRAVISVAAIDGFIIYAGYTNGTLDSVIFKDPASTEALVKKLLSAFPEPVKR